MTQRYDLLHQRLRGAVQDMKNAAAEGDVEELLRQRAADLAARRLKAEAREILAEVVVVRRKDALLATPMSATNEVRTIEVVGFPGSGSVVNGVFHIRGGIFSLVDLARFFGETSPIRNGDRTPVAVISGSEGSLGLRIDEVVGPRQVFVDEIDDGLRERGLPFVTSITHDLVHILDIEALTALPEVLISGVSG